jgi:hypothetical protein
MESAGRATVPVLAGPSREEALVGCWVWNGSALRFDIGSLFAIFGGRRGSL